MVHPSSTEWSEDEIHRAAVCAVIQLSIDQRIPGGNAEKQQQQDAHEKHPNAPQVSCKTTVHTPNDVHQRPGANGRPAWKENVIAGFAACNRWTAWSSSRNRNLVAYRLSVASNLDMQHRLADTLRPVNVREHVAAVGLHPNVHLCALKSKISLLTLSVASGDTLQLQG